MVFDDLGCDGMKPDVRRFSFARANDLWQVGRHPPAGAVIPIPIAETVRFTTARDANDVAFPAPADNPTQGRPSLRSGVAVDRASTRRHTRTGWV